MLNIKQIKKLQKSKKERINKNYILVEGNIEIKMALKGKFKLKQVIICKNIYFKKSHDYCILKKFLCFVNKNFYKKISYRNNTEGILGIFFKKKINNKKILKKIIKNKKQLIILDNLEKPGNLGAIIRTVETTKNCISIIINNNKDLYNPNIIRASLGCVFILPILILSFKNILKFIFKNNINLLGTSTYINNNNNKNLYKINFNNYNNKIAIIFGNEHNGISYKWKPYIKFNINIPMYGVVNSLNVSVAVSIIIYEIIRQIKFL